MGVIRISREFEALMEEIRKQNPFLSSIAITTIIARNAKKKTKKKDYSIWDIK